MQYILVFGAVFLIMLAVILLFFFLINTTAEDVSGQVRKAFLKEMEVFDELYEDNNAENVNKVELDKNEDSLNSNITENKEQIEQNTSNKAEDDGLDELRKQLGLI